MIPNTINKEYLKWLYNIVCKDRYSMEISYRKLFKELHNTVFTYSLKMDSNRAEDGVALRQRYVDDNDLDSIPYSLDKPCSVLEMMVALAIRCEETIMDNPKIGDRTDQWFWEMVKSLGLGTMNDDRYDEEFVKKSITRFLNRDYEPNGRGGLFTLRHCDSDLREIEIWVQLLWYLDTIA